MPAKLVYVSEKTHRRLKLLAARLDRTMGELVAEMVDQELANAARDWTSENGLALQQRALEQAWSDPALDVYDHD